LKLSHFINIFTRITCVTIISRTAVALEKESLHLEPPRDLLRPDFWEQYGTLVLVGGLLVLSFIAFLVSRWMQPEPLVMETPLQAVRRVLHQLCKEPKNPDIASQSSRALKRYIQGRLKLMPGEMTTREIREAIHFRKELPEALVSKLESFFEQCDQWSFSTLPPADSLDPVETALSLVDQVESALIPVPAVIEPVKSSEVLN